MAKYKSKVSVENGCRRSQQCVVKCKCGSISFWRNYAVRGTWEQYVESNDRGGVYVVGGTTEGLKNVREPKYMRCTECGKRVVNPASNAEVSGCRAHGNENTTGANGGSLH